jgi:hypothetical protein
MKNTASKILLLIIAAAIPLTILATQQNQDNRTKAQSAPNAGFIYRDGTKLMLNSGQYKFAGYNADTWFGCWDNEIPSEAQLDQFFSELHPRSMTRIWPYPGTDLAIMDRIVAAAEKHDQFLAPSLMDGNGDCGQPEPNYGNPSRELAWIDQIVPRYKNSKAIGFWELINEPDGSNSNLKNYYKAMSDRIRSHDPKHLIGTGSHAAWSAGDNNEAKYVSDHDLPNVDLISMHEYDAATGVSHWGAASSRASRALNKPWYAGEDGFCCGGGDTGSAEGNAQKLKEEWAAYIAVPESAGMLYWDFKFGYKNNSTATFGNPLWEAGKTFTHQYKGGASGTNPGAGSPIVGGPSSGPQPTVPLSPAPTGVTPTIYCVGGVGAPPCAPLSPTIATAPIGGSGSITPGTTTPPVGGTNPTTNPVPSIEPCSTESSASVQHNNKSKKKPQGGFIERFIRFIFQLIEFLLQRLGIQIPGYPPTPPGGNPVPTQAPGGGNPNPTQTPGTNPTPCPEPTDTPAPTTGNQPTTAQPTAQPSIGLISPTVATQPTVNPTAGNAQLPAQVINLSNWKLQLPIGQEEKPTEIKQPALATYKSAEYFTVVNGGIRFRAPVNGVTTSGSLYPRSELREMTNSGADQASWSTSTGTHTMFLDQSITAVPATKKHVVAGQIHDGSDDVIVIRLEYPKLFIDIGGTQGPILDANYTLGKRFTIKFEANGGQMKVYYNNNTTPAHTYRKNVSSAYFKAGAYTQSNCTKEPASLCNANNYGEVIIYKTEVSHQ